MSNSQPASLLSLEVPTNVLKKISSTNSMHEFNSMKKKIENMYQEIKFPTGQVSLLATLERFLKSINTMRHTIMVPSRLMDQQLNPKITVANHDEPTSASNFDSLCPSVEPFCSLGHTTNGSNHGGSGIYFTVSCPPSPLPSLTCDQISFTSNSNCGSLASSSSSGLDSEHGNMYQIYQMLMNAKNDLVWNHENSNIEVEHPLYAKFKYHLDCLNSITAQFADLATDLTSNYESNQE